MLLVVGLGNPGRAHEGQRHNLGFLVLDALARAEGWPPFTSKFGGLFVRGELGGLPVAALKPQTYMNLSGESVQPAAAFLKVEPRDVIVVHDELDLAWKDVRLKAGGGHAGHNGLRSLLQHLGSPDFVRVRVGIGRPPSDRATPATHGATPAWQGNVHGWVLSGFDPVQRAELPEVLDRAADAVRRVARDGLAEAQKAVHTKP